MRNVLIFTGLFLVLAAGICLAQEEVTITTYYPSPHGVYDELESNKAAVGDTNGDGQLTSADLPPEDGQLHTARSVIFEPQTSLATIQAMLNPQQGELAYAASEDEWYYYNGAGWTTQAGGGKAVISVKCGWYTVGGAHSCVPPTCPAGWTPLAPGATSCADMGSAYNSSANQLWYVGYCERWCQEP
ncbi:hypothetical protein ACFL1D_00705 [Candidatus Omnitrophota bacterium]